MRKLLFGLALLGAACSAPTAPQSAVPLPQHSTIVARHIGFGCANNCTTPDGKSGYLINAGKTCDPCGQQ